MRQYTSKEIQNEFDKLPDALKGAITSTELHDKISSIGRKYNLHIDQVGELVDEIGLVILGLHKSSGFVDQTSRRLNVSSKLANQIAQDVNRDVFDTIKDYLKSNEPEPQIEPVQNIPVNVEDKTNSSLERIGDITIEKSDSEQENGKVTSEDRGDILATLENPPTAVPVPHTSQPPRNLPTEESGPFDEPAKTEESHTEPLVDHLLNNASSRPADVVRPSPVQQKPKTGGGPDPYREMIG